MSWVHLGLFRAHLGLGGGASEVGWGCIQGKMGVHLGLGGGASEVRGIRIQSCHAAGYVHPE